MRRNAIDLSETVAVVTGAASGLGRATARRLAQSGARVFGWDLSVPSAAEAGVTDSQVDVCDEAAIERTIEDIWRECGHIDLLVNCAAVLGPHAPIGEISREDWDRVIAVNLTGPFLTCRAVARHMKGRGAGRIINVSSAGAKDAHPFLSPYVAAKAGLVGLTRSLGKELGPFGVIVNCVTPGPMNTPMAQKGKAQMSEADHAALMQSIPLRREAEPEEVAAMIAWLASDECSYSTAATFDASGGRTTY